MNIIFDEIDFLPSGKLNEDCLIYWYKSESKINSASLKKFIDIWNNLNLSEKKKNKIFYCIRTFNVN